MRTFVAIVAVLSVLASTRADGAVILEAFADGSVRYVNGTNADGSVRFVQGDGSVRLVNITDGTSNTIVFDETTQVTFCFDNANVSTVTDGTSNTIFLGESVGVALPRNPFLSRNPINQIVDGTSNTIFFPETGPTSFCLGETSILDLVTITDGTSNTITVGETTDFDVCFGGARVGTRISDGTSNTILFPETATQACFTDVTVADDLRLTSVFAPSSLLLSITGLGMLGLFASRRSPARPPVG